MTIKGTLYTEYKRSFDIHRNYLESGIGPAFWWTSSRKLVVRIMELEERHNQD